MKRYPRITVYKDKSGQWRWRMVAGGRVVAESGEAYSERNKCVRAMCSVFVLDAAETGWAAGLSRRVALRDQDLIHIRIEGKR